MGGQSVKYLMIRSSNMNGEWRRIGFPGVIGMIPQTRLRRISMYNYATLDHGSILVSFLLAYHRNEASWSFSPAVNCMWVNSWL